MIQVRGVFSVTLIAWCLVTSSPRVLLSEQESSMADVLARAAQYVTAFADPSRLIVCEESYRHTFLHAANQPRFIFKKGGERKIEGVNTWEVKYQEKATPTVIRSTAAKDAPSTGSFWIDPATGRVLMSVLKNGDSSSLYDEMTVKYALDQALGLWLPTSLVDKTVDIEDEREVEEKGPFKKWRIVPRTAK